MKEKASPFLKSISKSDFIKKQYFISENEKSQLYNDPLMEEKHEVVKGLIHKYKNTVDGYDYFMKSGVIKSLASSKLQAMINYYIFKHLNNGIFL